MNAKIIFILSILLVAMLSGCTQSSRSVDSKRLTVFVSILPQKDSVKEVCAEKCDVKVMIPPGSSPATYDPAPRQLQELSSADIYFKIGYIPFEKAHIDAIKEANPHMRIIDTSAGIRLRKSSESNDSGVDPHIWLSPPLVKKQVETIASTLKEFDPENADFYESNKNKYIRSLDELDAEIRAVVNKMPSKKFMVFHPSWGYFADEYGLTQISIEIDGKEPTSGQIANLIDIANSEGIRIIFYQPQFSSESARTIANEIGGKVEPIDPLPENYIYGMKKVVLLLKYAY